MSVPDSGAGFIPIGQGRHPGGKGGIRNDQDDCDRASQRTDHEAGNHKKTFFLVCTPSGGVEDAPGRTVLPLMIGPPLTYRRQSPERVSPGDGSGNLVFNHNYATQCRKSSRACPVATAVAGDRRSSHGPDDPSKILVHYMDTSPVSLGRPPYCATLSFDAGASASSIDGGCLRSTVDESGSRRSDRRRRRLSPPRPTNTAGSPDPRSRRCRPE